MICNKTGYLVAFLLLSLTCNLAQALPIANPAKTPCSVSNSQAIVDELAENVATSDLNIGPALTQIQAEGGVIQFCAFPVANDIWHQTDFWVDDVHYYFLSFGATISSLTVHK